MKTIRFLILLLINSLSAQGQQEPLYTQYMYNELSINPACAGNHEATNLSLLARKQWAGINGTPVSFTFIGDKPLLKNKLGAGIVIYNDQIGVSNTFQYDLAYSYKIKFRHNLLSFGLQGVVERYSESLNRLENVNNDPSFQSNVQSTMFNAGAGIYLQSDLYYLGLSVPQIFKNYYDPSNKEGGRQLRQYFLTGGYLFFVSQHLKFKPGFLMRYIDGFSAQFDINGNFLYRDKVWFGLSYRQNNSVNIVLNFLLSEKLRIGWAYDYTTGPINKIFKGSGEVMLNYQFKKVKKRIINPRRF